MTRYLAASLLMVLVFFAVRLVGVHKPAPVYGGKAVVQWLDSGYEDAALAIEQIGPPAVPYILDKVGREDPRAGSLRWYRTFLNKVPAGLRGIFPKPRVTNFDELRACSLILEIGPGAIPRLSTSLQDSNSMIRQTSAHALEAFHERGINISRAIPSLTIALRDSDPDVRKYAGTALQTANLR